MGTSRLVRVKPEDEGELWVRGIDVMGGIKVREGLVKTNDANDFVLILVENHTDEDVVLGKNLNIAKGEKIKKVLLT
ncbi:MAG: hypothetical protein ACK56F_18270, partial [bacterium]